MRACGAPPRFELKKLIWLSSGLESWSVNATRRPSTGETIGLLMSPILAWKPVVRETARQGEPGQLGPGGLSVLPMSVWVAAAGRRRQARRSWGKWQRFFSPPRD